MKTKINSGALLYKMLSYEYNVYWNYLAKINKKKQVVLSNVLY